MFCLDYALAFFVHAKSIQLYQHFAAEAYPAHGHHSSPGHRTLAQAARLHFASGAFAGLVAAVVLYPFDVVRQIATSTGSSVQPSTSSFGYGTVPFMTLYIGVYFTAIERAKAQQQRISLYDRVFFAGGATALAAAAEFPLDKAKQELMGRNLPLAFATSVLRIPLGALLLISYDHILSSFSTS